MLVAFILKMPPVRRGSYDAKFELKVVECAKIQVTVRGGGGGGGGV